MLALIALPEFDAAAAAWIATIRAAHDPRHAQVPPHVTLVFPTDALALEDLRRAAAKLGDTAPFAATFDRLGIAEDAFTPKYRHLVYLLPEAASAARLAALQAALGLPGRDGHPPHVTIARFGAIFSAKALVRQTGQIAPATARIAALQLLRIENGQIAVEAAFALA